MMTSGASESFVVIPACENEKYSNCILEEGMDQDQVELVTSLHNEDTSEGTTNVIHSNCLKQDSNKLCSAIWTTHSTSTLLKLYEEKLEMLETPKKKTRIWVAIAENLKDYDIDVTPDQVRWKINALTKKYKRCIDMGKHEKFKYFKEMDNIYAKYNVDCDSYNITEFLSKKKFALYDQSKNSVPETRAMIEMRKARLAKRIDCDRFQGKINLEKQWLQYLHKQEEDKLWRDKIFERNLKLREEMLETRKREFEINKNLEYRKLQLMEKEQKELLEVEREKCELLKQLFC